VHASKAERAAQRYCAGDPQKFEQLPGRLNFEVIPNLDNFQAAHRAGKRHGSSPSWGVPHSVSRSVDDALIVLDAWKVLRIKIGGGL
jgi:hypothetical protein